MNGTSSRNDTLIRLTAARLKKISTTEVSPQLKEKTTLAILDYLGAVASGLKAPWASQAIKYGRSQQGVREAHAWGLQEDASAKTAAYVNALLAHSAIRDDMHLKSNSHIGGIVISAALALAQRDNWSGDQLLRAVIGGYEAASFIGTAVQQSAGYNRHFRPSGICGGFGAAAAAITASNASEDVAINALAFAANMGSGVNEWAWAGGVEIYTEMGSASQAGIDAFELAKAGLECSETLLEGRAGLFAALGASEGTQLYQERLQTEIGSGLIDVRFKPVAGCNYAQTPIAVAIWLSQKHDLSKGIKSVHVDCTSGAKQYPGCDNPGPFSNVQQTKMAIHFGVSTGLLHGKVSEELFKQYDSQDIANVVSCCTVEAAQDFEQSFKEGRQPARVSVTLKDGSVVKEELPDVPWLDGEAVRARYGEKTAEMLGSDRSRRLADLLGGLGDLKDCSDIFKFFKG
ncbi:uncharacterized protein LTR77_006864 [Saxophila tyrrhenica]|uniref:MmgE/PrpD family protein n=1 Tax=Saxophila tyrrhenica TaxID=1690608 RepID=A0AAV9P8Y9_9PEZI|nr:hypothetical protein LTR77_006864 [Saxophila tyrrhenica]